jgi:hypothetical protein
MIVAVGVKRRVEVYQVNGTVGYFSPHYLKVITVVKGIGYL